MPRGLAAESTRKYIFDNLDAGKPTYPQKFWCDDHKNHTESCCFWHWIFYPKAGPERDGIYHPVYEYEKILLDDLESHKTLAVYKATGLGITEFMLLWILWKSLVDPFFQGKEAIIVTGPNVDLAQDLIKRAKAFIDGKVDYIDNGAYEFTVNGSRIKCYPSNNIHSARGKPKISIFFGDEAAFFKLQDDRIVRTVGERYIGKSNSWVVWVSTAGETIEGFFYEMMNEPNSAYIKRHFYYEWGLKKDPKTGTSLFSPLFIEAAMKQRSFAREYMGEWGANVGDIFEKESLNQICADDYPINHQDGSYDRIICIDPGFGSSRFGIVIGQRHKKIPHVLYAKDFERQSGSEMLAKIAYLSKVFRTRKVRCDSSRPEIIKDLRDTYHLDVVGYGFKELRAKMTENASERVSRLDVRIHPMFKRLRLQLETIKYDKQGGPDKDNSNPFDLGDAFLMMLWYYRMGGSGVCEVVNPEE